MRIMSYRDGDFVGRPMRGGAGQVGMLAVLQGSDFETAFEFVVAGRLAAGVSVGLHRHHRSEACLVLLDGPLLVAGDRAAAMVEPPAVALCRAGETHGIINRSIETTTLLGIGVASEDGPFEAEDLGDDLTTADAGDPAALTVEPLDQARLQPVRAHVGLGEIRFRRLFDHEAFATNWGFVDHALVPPGTSVGYHRHDTVEECYIVTGGRGRMKVDGEVAEVAAGDCIPNRIGGSHGIINHSDQPLEFLNIAVFQRKGRFDATDLDDDLGDLL